MKLRLLHVHFGSLTTSVTALLLSTATLQAATLDPWTFIGPGTTSIDISDGDLIFNYGGNSATSASYTAATTVIQGGDFTFDWTYAGLHSWFRAKAFLNSSVPGVDVATQPVFGGFSFSGSETVNLSVGDTVSFNFGGSHSDSSNVLQGSLTLAGAQVAPVPLPASAFLMFGGLFALGVARKRRKA